MPSPSASTTQAFLLTIDVHPWRQALSGEVGACLAKLRGLGIPATFFVPGALARDPVIASLLKQAADEGHQVACHGLFHDREEDFRREPFDRQCFRLRIAKEALEDATEHPVTAFRAPAFRLSGPTLLALAQEGYSADLSVTPQRFPLLSSQPGNVYQLVAPRSPYRPSSSNPCLRGSLEVWEIPTTCFLVPYTSLLHQALGLRAARGMTRLVFDEAARYHRPIVYMCHAEEFVPSSAIRPRRPLRLRDLFPSPRDGVRARELLYERDEYRIYCATMDLLATWLQHPDLSFLTVDQFLSRFLCQG